MEDAKKYEGVVMICREQDVQSACSNGYRLREIIYTDQIGHCSDTTSGMVNGFTSVNKSVVLREPRFVMVQELDDALAQQQDTINELQAELRAREKSEGDALKKANAHKEVAKQLEAERVRLSDSLRAEIKGKDDLRASNRKLEGDIAKIRGAIGDLKMKDILVGDV